MSSPLEALEAEMIYYFDAVLSPERRNHDDIDAFEGDDIKIVFTVKRANGEEVDLSGAGATFRISPVGNDDALIALNETAGIVLSGETATVSFNVDDLEAVGKFRTQFRIAKSGKSVVAAYGNINVSSLIE